MEEVKVTDRCTLLCEVVHASEGNTLVNVRILNPNPKGANVPQPEITVHKHLLQPVMPEGAA